jgi:hypothetical protein
MLKMVFKTKKPLKVEQKIRGKRNKQKHKDAV